MSTDTELNRLPIGKCKKSSLDDITPEANEILFVDPEFAGNKFLKTTANGEIEEADLPQVSVSFSEITGQPTDNANLSAALNAKQDLIDEYTANEVETLWESE